MEDTEFIRPKDQIKMNTPRFLDHVREGYRANQRYCFILGSGASFNSRIPTGLKFIREWRDELLKREKSYKGYIKECAAGLGMDYEKDVKRLFEPDYKIQSEDYFDFYDLRFENQPVAAYKYMQEIMEKAEPSFGYYALAILLEKSDIKLVITTNFDTLTEDALFMCHTRHPLVVGHESLASYIGTTENSGRPVVAKIHRDMLLHPLNRRSELEELDKRWEKELREVFARYIPIVIGYAGGDGTLMKLLERMDLPEIYWCSIWGEERERITNLLRKQPRGFLVKILGFDEIMLQLLDTLLRDVDYDTPDVRMKKLMTERATEYVKQFDDISKKVYSGSVVPSSEIEEMVLSPLQGRPEKDSQSIDESQPTLKKLEPTTGAPKEVLDASKIKTEAQEALINNDFAKALDLCQQFVKLHPDDFDVYEMLSDAYYGIGEKNKALDMSKKDVGIGKGEFLLRLRSMVLSWRNRNEEALIYINKLIELGSDNHNYYYARSSALYNLGKYSEALNDINKVIEECPNDIASYYLRSNIFRSIGDTEGAEADFAKAEQLQEEQDGQNTD